MDIEENTDDSMDIDDTAEAGSAIESRSYLLGWDSDLNEHTSSTRPRRSRSTGQATAVAEDIVVLDDDDSSVDDVINLVSDTIPTQCINYSCKSGKQLIRAPGFCLSYFRFKGPPTTNQKICRECYDNVVEMFGKWAVALQKGKPLMEVECPLVNDMVQIIDSDEDSSDEDKESLSERNVKFITKNIDKVVKTVMKKHNVAQQMEKEKEAIKEHLTKTSGECKVLSGDVSELRAVLDNMQIEFYNQFRPQTTDAGEVTIIDDPTLLNEYNENGTKKKVKKVPKEIRKSARKTNRPSYSDMEQGGYNESEDSSSSAVETSTTVNVDADPDPDPENTESRSLEPTNVEPDGLPQFGSTHRPPIKFGQIYYIARDTNTGCWIKARCMGIIVTNLTNSSGTKAKMYRFVELKQQKERVVDGKHIAYLNSCPTRLQVGARIIAALRETSTAGVKRLSNPYYQGVVAEPPYSKNYFRYLIFFDIGYAQYVDHTMVNLIFEVSKEVWDDMPSDCRPFIKKHIESRDWPMVKLKKEQKVIIEYQGRWWLCTVVDLDCSLVQVYFQELNRYEWIYRGSRRLKDIYEEEKAATRNLGTQRASRKVDKSESNVVQYMPNLNFNNEPLLEPPQPEQQQPQQPLPPPEEQDKDQNSKRAVARKSTTARPVGRPNLPPPDDTKVLNSSGPISKIMYFTPRDQSIVHRRFKRHTCSRRCQIYLTHAIGRLRGQNPLSKPLLCGWARITVKCRGTKHIIYKAPCGHHIRNIAEVHCYLRLTESDMTVDLFDFNHHARCLAEFSVECSPDSKDLSRGLEEVAVPVVNGVNTRVLDFSNYTIRRIPMQNVSLNLNPDFLVCCDCDNDCTDKLKCACWRLTLEGTSYFDLNDFSNIGYTYRRLHDQVVSGIYECNSRCKCKSTCLNRVVQNPMSLKLQVFSTHNRGWGIRCLNDVPMGAFICIYAGTIHTDQQANENGKKFGDEYFAELDYIESVEKFKDDYEEEALLDEEDQAPSTSATGTNETANKSKPNSKKRYMDDDDFVLPWMTKLGSPKDMKSRLRNKSTKTSSKPGPSHRIEVKKEYVPQKYAQKPHIQGDVVTISDDEDEDREILSFNPAEDSDEGEKSSQGSVRQLYGKNEAIYIMDAKNAGNIGRFLNHSCSPNVFVQNVFVDTHDPRFPWVAFFASQFIRAGTELTWNYSYDIGSVPGRILYCHCASLECKGRLL